MQSPEEIEAHLTRVGAHIRELRGAGRMDEAEAVQFVRDVAVQVLAPGGRARPRELLTTGQTAQALGLSDQTVRNWVSAGRLPAVRRGVRTMIPTEAVQAQIDQSRAPESGSDADQVSPLAWRRQLLAALPSDVTARLAALHEKLEAGQNLSEPERADIERLELQMADAAARALGGSLKPRPARPR